MSKKKVEEAVQGVDDAVVARRPPRTAAGCAAYMRSELTRRFPEIVEGFVKVAEEGSCPHVKLAKEILEAGRPLKARRSRAASVVLKKIAEI